MRGDTGNLVVGRHRAEAFAVARVEPGRGGLRAQVAGQRGRATELDAGAACGAGVLEGGAPAQVGLRDDLVVSAGLEDRGGEFAEIGHARFHAGFHTGAARRLQCEVQAGGATRAVGQLVQRRCFETAAGGGVQAQFGAEREQYADDRQRGGERGCTAVVGVGADDVVVGRRELDPAVAQAGVHAQRWRELQRSLQVLVEVRHVVVLVAAQRAFHAERGAHEVLVTDAVLGQLVVGQAGHERSGQLAERALDGPAHIGAAVVAPELDHAAGVQRVGLRAGRNGLELLGLAVAAVDQRTQRVVRVELPFVDEASLQLVDGLACVEAVGHRVDTARVGFELRTREAQRVFGPRQRQAVGKQREFAVGIGRERELHVAERALGGAVIAVAVGREAAGAGHVTEVAVGAAELRAQAQRAVAAARHARAERRRARACFAENLNHAARRVAVERRERATQHLDAVGRAEVDVADLALPVG